MEYILALLVISGAILFLGLVFNLMSDGYGKDWKCKASALAIALGIMLVIASWIGILALIMV